MRLSKRVCSPKKVSRPFVPLLTYVVYVTTYILRFWLWRSNIGWQRDCEHYFFYAFQVLIHSPAEWPDQSHPTLLASPNTLQTMSIKPMVLSTFEELTSWSPERRHCYFQNEKNLRFFKIYTQKNCILECRSSNILARCGCVPFYYLSTDIIHFKSGRIGGNPFKILWKGCYLSYKHKPWKDLNSQHLPHNFLFWYSSYCLNVFNI